MGLRVISVVPAGSRAWRMSAYATRSGSVSGLFGLRPKKVQPAVGAVATPRDIGEPDCVGDDRTEQAGLQPGPQRSTEVRYTGDRHPVRSSEADAGVGRALKGVNGLSRASNRVPHACGCIVSFGRTPAPICGRVPTDGSAGADPGSVAAQVAVP
jgi:hypothetical protein